MDEVLEFFKWWIVDDHTGERRLTAYKLNRADAHRAFPGVRTGSDNSRSKECSEKGGGAFGEQARHPLVVSLSACGKGRWP
jgi:hypothetical protein